MGSAWGSCPHDFFFCVILFRINIIMSQFRDSPARHVRFCGTHLNFFLKHGLRIYVLLFGLRICSYLLSGLRIHNVD